MISRYTLLEMGNLWSDQSKFEAWLKVEILATEAQARLGVVPEEALTQVRDRAAFDIGRVLEIEAEVRHDVIAFLTNVAEHVGDASRYVHLGMTSSDLLDTAFGYTMKRAGEMLLADIDRLREVLAGRASEFKYTPCIGRSHGVHAEPTTFGLKLALWYDEMNRARQQLEAAIASVAVGKISGAVGTFAHIDPRVEEYVCEKLGLLPAPVSTQIVQRDRHAQFLSTLALVGASLEKFSTEVRNLQRTEIREVEEYFGARQKGSSAMPHKRNPITCEQISGLARVLRGNAQAALENVSLWHERDITHSSVERVIVPDSCILLNYMLNKFTNIIEKLLVYPDRMMENLALTHGLIFSQAVLLKLTRENMLREKAYRLVQDAATKTWESGTPFQDNVKNNAEIREHLGDEEIDSCFDLNKMLGNVDFIFSRVGI